MKKIVFAFDIDGTLIDLNTGLIPNSSIEAINKLRSLGYPCIFATGRTYGMAKAHKQINDIEVDGFVGVNGSQVLDHNFNVIYEDILDKKLILDTINVANNLHHPLLLMENDDWTLVNEKDENLDKVLKYIVAKDINIGNYNNQKVYYLMVCADTKSYDFKAYEDLGYEVAKSYLPYADLIKKGANKAKGIKKYLAYYGYDKYIGFGDSLNDYKMLIDANYSVLMENGDLSFKEKVDYISDSPSKDGIIKSINYILEKINRGEI